MNNLKIRSGHLERSRGFRFAKTTAQSKDPVLTGGVVSSSGSSLADSREIREFLARAVVMQVARGASTAQCDSLCESHHFAQHDKGSSADQAASGPACSAHDDIREKAIAKTRKPRPLTGALNWVLNTACEATPE